jgi:RHS repeat-associated protein
MQPLKPYNRMQMQLASNSVLSQPPLAAMPQLSEKPRLGFATKKSAWNPGPNVCNFTVTLGLQVVVSENGVRKTYSARYYNPNTGRFLSRDPEDGNAKIPATLHKYLYAGGDPINRIDPTGRDDAADYSSLLANESWKTQLEMRATAAVVDDILECIEVMLSFGFSQGYIDKFCWPL